MTNLEALIGEIEPYSLSDDSVEKSFIDACARFTPSTPGVSGNYTADNKKTIAYAAMMCLNRLRVLASENIGGISQSFSVSKLEKRIAAIAESAGLSPDLVLADGDENKVTAICFW